jgi:uncharacterized membrane protein YgcG
MMKNDSIDVPPAVEHIVKENGGWNWKHFYVLEKELPLPILDLLQENDLMTEAEAKSTHPLAVLTKRYGSCFSDFIKQTTDPEVIRQFFKREAKSMTVLEYLQLRAGKIKQEIDSDDEEGFLGEEEYFSFCYGDVVQDIHDSHCEECGQCYDWHYWHCDNCNRCSYGQSLPKCEWCGQRNDGRLHGDYDDDDSDSDSDGGFGFGLLMFGNKKDAIVREARQRIKDEHSDTDEVEFKWTRPAFLREPASAQVAGGRGGRGRGGSRGGTSGGRGRGRGGRGGRGPWGGGGGIPDEDLDPQTRMLLMNALFGVLTGRGMNLGGFDSDDD